MKDYEHLGLNSKLQAKSSLANRTKFQDAYTFNAEGDINLINDYNTRTIKANHIYGGTLTLGGTENVSGVLSLKDEGGTEKISMDKDGMTVNGGKITVYNASGTAVLDSLGLNSNNNFNSTYYTTNASGTAVGTALVTLGTVGTISTTRALKVFFYLNGYIADYETVLTTDEPTSSTYLYLSVGTITGMTFLNSMGIRIPFTGGYTTDYELLFGGRLYSLSAGTYPVTVKLSSDEATGTAITGGFNAGYFALGQ